MLSIVYDLSPGKGLSKFKDKTFVESRLSLVYCTFGVHVIYAQTTGLVRKHIKINPY